MRSTNKLQKGVSSNFKVSVQISLLLENHP